uniref:(northern house mosquito) hypothetical protein n=1 Tax=Culex pipiens TaxID=7175 RepID=A0A8D8KMZ4_CULPI
MRRIPIQTVHGIRPRILSEHDPKRAPNLQPRRDRVCFKTTHGNHAVLPSAHHNRHNHAVHAPQAGDREIPRSQENHPSFGALDRLRPGAGVRRRHNLAGPVRRNRLPRESATAERGTDASQKVPHTVRELC